MFGRCGVSWIELGSKARIVAKIEEQAGVRNMEEIIHAADAIMVARGDLGIEIDYHKLPLVQTQLVRACQAEGKPVIIATHLLESMIHSPIPTRAEISDVCNAVREQADAVMLSGETTTGEYPLESVEVLKNIILSIEPTVSDQLNSSIKLHEPKAKMLRSSAVLAQELGESGIVVFTRSGFLAYVLGALRARGVPIYAFTDIESTFRQLLLPWGVEPFLMEFSEDPEQTILGCSRLLETKGLVRSGALVGRDHQCACQRKGDRYDATSSGGVTSSQSSRSNCRQAPWKRKRVPTRTWGCRGGWRPRPRFARSSPVWCCSFSFASWR